MAIHDLSSEECHLRGRSGSRTKVLLPPGGIIEKKKRGGLGKISYLRRRGNYSMRLDFKLEEK